jgi:hypothetical protein
VTVSDPMARGLQMRDVRIESSHLGNVDLTGSSLERVEFVSTRLTGATFTEAQLKSVLFQECKLDLALWRMARLEQCVFERCNLVEVDFYSADLRGVVFRGCDLTGADVSHAKLAGADLRECRLDRMRGKAESMESLVISPDQAALLITLFGVGWNGDDVRDGAFLVVRLISPTQANGWLEWGTRPQRPKTVRWGTRFANLGQPLRLLLEGFCPVYLTM